MAAPTPSIFSNLKINSKESKVNDMKIEELLKLQDTTKQLLIVLESLQSTTFCKGNIQDDLPNFTNVLKSNDQKTSRITSVADIINSVALQNLENQAKHLDGIFIENEDDDFSVYKRLTRKCNCLNRVEFNDFVIHFNGEAKYSTNNHGEIIKNVRILKKFLYMGGKYTNNALVFLIEGLTKCVYAEKAEIALACSHADVCNVFDNESIVVLCISLPFKYSSCGDAATQYLAAKLILSLVRVEEGRRYLNFNSKIATQIKRILRKKQNQLDSSTTEYLREALELLNPPIDKSINVTYYFKAEEGSANRVINGLVNFRHYMTTEEIYNNLDLLNQISESDSGKTELGQFMPVLLNIFKHLLIEYDSNQMNTAIISILTNLTKKTLESVVNNPKEPSGNSPTLVANIWTETTNQQKSEFIQMPSMKNLANSSKKTMKLKPWKPR